MGEGLGEGAAAHQPWLCREVFKLSLPPRGDGGTLVEVVVRADSSIFAVTVEASVVVASNVQAPFSVNGAAGYGDAVGVIVVPARQWR